MPYMQKLLDIIFGVPDSIIYNQLLADRLQEIIDQLNVTNQTTRL
jgi:hypothetical protein